MSALLFHLITWPALGAGLLVFGFAPGAALRLILLLYARDHPRRRELLAELYAVRRIERPFWVAEQLETALFEGVPDHVAGWRARRMVPAVVVLCDNAKGEGSYVRTYLPAHRTRMSARWNMHITRAVSRAAVAPDVRWPACTVKWLERKQRPGSAPRLGKTELFSFASGGSKLLGLVILDGPLVKAWDERIRLHGDPGWGIVVVRDPDTGTESIYLAKLPPTPQ